MDFDLRLLRHARALAEHGNFARAARSLHLTQPALSRSIQELERRTGIKLFERGKGGVDPTDLGRAFLERARTLLGHAETLEREVALLRGTGTGQLVVGSGTFPSVMFMGRAVATFLESNPKVGLRLVNDSWLNLLGALRRGETDLIVAGEPPPDATAELCVTRLSERPGRFLVRPGHPLSRRDRPTLSDVLAYPLASIARLPPGVTDALLSARGARDSGRALPDLGCDSVGLMKQVVAATDHVLMTPLCAAADELATGSLLALPVVEPGIRATFAIAWLGKRSLPPVAEAFVRAVVAADLQSAREEIDLEARFVGRTRAGKRPVATARRPKAGAPLVPTAASSGA